MATWQFDFFLIPRNEARRLLQVSEPSRRREMFDEMSFWSKSQPPADYASQLGVFLDETASWSAHRRIWGTDEGNRVEIRFEGKRVVEIYVRVDMRNLDAGFLENLVRFADGCDAWVLTEEMELSEPGLDWLVSAAIGSTAGRFVANPRRFIEDLDQRSSASGSG